MKLFNRLFVLLIQILLVNSIASSQDLNQLKSISGFAAETGDYLEGYTQNAGGNDFTYHCFRNDLSKCLLTRCTTGNMAIEWKTQAVPC